MSSAHFHLLINHFPVIGAYVLLLLTLISLRWKSEGLQRIIYSFFILFAVTSYISLTTGEQAEHQLRDSGLMFQGMHEYIELHETAATWTWFTFLAGGVLSVIGFIKSQACRWLIPALLIVSMAVSGLASLTALYGGEIRHTEIRTDAVSQQADAIHLPELKKKKHRKPAPQADALGDDS